MRDVINVSSPAPRLEPDRGRDTAFTRDVSLVSVS